MSWEAGFPIMMMNRQGRMNSIIGITSSAGSLPALSSNWIIRSLRISAASVRSPWLRGVPYFRVCAMVRREALEGGLPRAFGQVGEGDPPVGHDAHLVA